MYKNYWLDKKREREELPPAIVVDWGVPPVISCTVTIQCPTCISTVSPPLYISDKIEVSFADIPTEITITPPDPAIFYITVPDIPHIDIDLSNIPTDIKIADIQLPPIVFSCLEIDFS